MKKWEYCKIITPVSGASEKVSSAVKFLRVTEHEAKEIGSEDIDCELAKLGADGWELVSHTQTWMVALSNGIEAYPQLEVYLLKREIV